MLFDSGISPSALRKEKFGTATHKDAGYIRVKEVTHLKQTMKIKKLTGEDGEVKFEVYEEKTTLGGWDSYVGSFTLEALTQLKAALNARDDI